MARTSRALALFGTVIAFCASAPAGAQEAAAPAEQTGTTDAEAAEFFSTIEALAKAGRPLPVAPEQQAAMDREFGKILAEITRPGPRVAGWNSAGVDLRRVLAPSALFPGAMALVSESAGAFGVDLIDGAAARTLLGRDWVKVATLGPELPSEDLMHGVSTVSPKVIMYLRAEVEKVGTATCTRRAHVEVYSDPGRPATEEDTIAFFAARYLVKYLNKGEFCEVTRQVGPGRYEVHSYDRQGRRLTKLDENLPVSVVKPVREVRLPKAPGLGR